MSGCNGLWSVLLSSQLVAAVQSGFYDSWKPHAYCNDVQHIHNTRIEPLSAQQQSRVVGLIQVQILARHGGRAPYYRVFCWDDKKFNPMNAQWNCSTSSVSDIESDRNGAEYGRLYRKQYMAAHNVLKGDCVVGGLLPEGRQQHLKNGEYMREAYIGQDPLKLFPHSNLSSLDVERIYLRSDDQERTLGSGQVLMDAFFPNHPIESRQLDHLLAWNVADMETDYINANEKFCPLMSYISSASVSSQAYQNHISSGIVQHVEQDFHHAVGQFSWSTVLECLSVARCNNLPLPPGIDEALFNKVYQEVEARQALVLTFNESWYSKTAMQPLFEEMLLKLDAALKDTDTYTKLAIYMGHDATLMPFLAALQRQEWDRTWTPYAGVFVMEVYKTQDSHAIRTLYKGKPLKIPECNDTLCDVSQFLSAVQFARKPRTCRYPAPSNKSHVWYRYFVPLIIACVIVLGAVLFFGSRQKALRSHERESLLSPA